MSDDRRFIRHVLGRLFRKPWFWGILFALAALWYIGWNLHG